MKQKPQLVAGVQGKQRSNSTALGKVWQPDREPERSKSEMDNTTSKPRPSIVDRPPWRTELEEQVFLIQCQALKEALKDPRVTHDALRALVLSMLEPRQ